MEKVLLVGEEVSGAQTLKLQLTTNFRVQYINFLDCDEIKLFKPDFVIIYSEAATKENLIKLKKRLLNDNFFTVPMFCIAIPKEAELVKTVFCDKDVVIIERNPFDAKSFIEMLKKLDEDSKPEATEKVVENEVNKADKKRILVVDDDPVVLQTVKALMDEEFDIVLASSGKDALIYLAKNDCDIVLLDYMMPEFDGRETLEMIRNNPKTKNLPVFFLSGISDKEKIKLTLKLNPQGYILKPASKLDIYEKIEKYM